MLCRVVCRWWSLSVGWWSHCKAFKWLLKRFLWWGGLYTFFAIRTLGGVFLDVWRGVGVLVFSSSGGITSGNTFFKILLMNKFFSSGGWRGSGWSWSGNSLQVWWTLIDCICRVVNTTLTGHSTLTNKY